jgi:ferrochelatase
MKKGILLINVGSPEAATKKAVRRYLHQFLLDKRVIAKPRIIRELLVRCLIVPFRLNAVTKLYQEFGFPLLKNSQELQELLQKELGASFQVETAMRYQKPSIEEALEKLKTVETLIVLPLFPQYASATTGTAFEEVMTQVKNWELFPQKKMVFLNSFWNHPLFVEAWKERAESYDLDSYDHILFSFHGLPVAQDSGSCYKNGCYGTADAIATLLKIKKERYTVVFQSRLGKQKWLEPYLVNTVEAYAKEKKKILVFSPSFVADCLETTYELGVEVSNEFKKYGGEQFDVVPSLNCHPKWVQTLKTLIHENI